MIVSSTYEMLTGSQGSYLLYISLQLLEVGPQMSEFQSPVAVIGYPSESILGEKRFKPRRQVRISSSNIRERLS